MSYCESILFRGAEISSFEDEEHIPGYLTSWIALPTKYKKLKKKIPFKRNGLPCCEDEPGSEKIALK